MHLQQRILVTGGSGFLGSHLCERLLAEGANVICVDNFFTGSRRNVEHLLDDKHFELIRHDVTFPIYLEVDQIYNLACPASPVHYQHDPVQTTKTSVHGAINMLGLAKRVKAKILQASTSEVYGDPNVHPQTEDYWGHVNPIGPRMHPNDGRVVSNFVVQALLGKDITIYGDGSQTRSFCYVDDLIDGLMRLMASGDTVTGPINIGHPNEFTILELATVIIEMIGTGSKIVRCPLPENDPRQRKPSIALAKKQLSWEPRTQLKEGLGRTIAYFEKLLAESNTRQILTKVYSARESLRRRPGTNRGSAFMPAPFSWAQGPSPVAAMAPTGQM